MKTTHSSGVTLEDVADAVRQLQEEGERVSTRNVRARIGRGSMKTILDHLQLIRAGQTSAQEVFDAFPEKLAEQCKQLVATLNDLAAEAVAVERGHVEAARRNVEEKWAGLMLEKETAVRDLAAEHRMNEDLRAQIDALQRNLSEKEGQLTALYNRTSDAEASNSTLTEQNINLDAKVRLLQSHIENYTEQVRAQREADTAKHSSQVALLESHNATLRASELSLTQHLGEANRKADGFSNKMVEAIRAGEQMVKKIEDQQALIADLTIEVNSANKQLGTYEANALTQSATISDVTEKLTKALDRQLALQESVYAERDLREKAVSTAKSESKSVILNIIEHSRRMFQLASNGTNKSSDEYKELEISQREIERLIGQD